MLAAVRLDIHTCFRHSTIEVAADAEYAHTQANIIAMSRDHVSRAPLVNIRMAAVVVFVRTVPGQSTLAERGKQCVRHAHLASILHLQAP